MAADVAPAPQTPLVRLWQATLGRLTNPLASKELLARMRGPRTFVIVMLELVPLAAIAGGVYYMMASASNADVPSSAPIGRLFFAGVTAVELGLICLLAPALTADLISGERERQTLDLLLVTPLSRRQIVVGKLVAALGSLLLLILLALPIQAVAVLIGGVGLEELAVGMVLLILTATTYGCAGLYWSARLRSTRAAMLFSYITMLVGTCGVPMLVLLMAIGDGLFGLDMDVWIWPLSWLINGATNTSSRMGNTSLMQVDVAVLHVQAWIGQLLAATNPLVAGIASAAALAEGRPVVGFERILQTDILYVAPWLLFGVVHLLASVFLIWRTGRCLRRARA